MPEIVAFTSGAHSSVSAGRSFLVSAKESIRLFAYEGALRWVSALGNIEIAALHAGVHMAAKTQVKFSAHSIYLQAQESVQLSGAGNYMQWTAAQVEEGSLALWRAHGAQRQIGEHLLATPLINTPSAACKECLRRAALTQSPLTTAGL